MNSRSELRAAWLLALADDALVASHRLSEWVARAPELEEDIALANVALDLLGQARLLLAHAGEVTDPPCTEDDLAYGRAVTGFRNATMVERPNGDFAVTMARMLLFAAYQYELYRCLLTSQDPALAAIAAKAVKEVDYHRDHAAGWVVRLGDGTAESHRRMQAGLEAEWPGFCSLLTDWADAELVRAGTAIDPATLREPVLGWIGEALGPSTLSIPDFAALGDPGRDGQHTPALDEIVSVMREVTSVHPGASW